MTNALRSVNNSMENQNTPSVENAQEQPPMQSVGSGTLLGRLRVDGTEITGEELCRLFGYRPNIIMLGLACGHIESQYGKIDWIERPNKTHQP